MKCVECHQRKGKRECPLHDGAGICGQCCAAIRTPENCTGCLNFKQAENYQKKRARQGSQPPLIMRIDEEVDEETYQELKKIEAGMETEKSKKRIRKLYQANPDLSCTQYAMGVVHLIQQNPDKAISYFQEAVNTNPYFEEAYFNLAESYRRNMDIIPAIRTLQTAQEIAEYGGPIRAKIDNSLQEYIETIKKFEGISLEEFLESAEAFECGVRNMGNKKWRQAISDFEESIKKHPKMPQAYGNMGICRGRLGEKEQARKMLEKALELDPSYEPAKWNLKAIDKISEDEDVADVVSIEYGADRYREEREKQKDKSGAVNDNSASSRLNFLRRRSRM